MSTANETDMILYSPVYMESVLYVGMIEAIFMTYAPVKSQKLLLTRCL